MGNGKTKKEIIQSVKRQVEAEVLTSKKHPKRSRDAFL